MASINAQRNRRALILLVAAVVLYLMASEFALPWYDELRAAPELAADKAEQLRKYRRGLTHRGNYEALTMDIRKKIADARQYFFSDPAELQKIAEEGAKTVGIDLTQRSATQTRKVDDLVNEFAMTMTFEATPGQLVRFLDQLRTSPKVVNVRNVQVDPTQTVYEPPKAGELRKTLRVNLTIAGDGLSPAAQETVK